MEKCSTLGKKRHTWKSVQLLKKCSKRGKLRHTWKTATWYSQMNLLE